MIERYRLQVPQEDQPEPSPNTKRADRAEPNRMKFSDMTIKRLKPPKAGQVQYWDRGDGAQRGLSLLVSAGGTKTFRSMFCLNGNWLTRSVGKVGAAVVDGEG